MARVRLNQLTKVYPGPVRALDRVSFDVADGELVVMVGPSGSGKTTTLRLIAGLETITEGNVTIGDRIVNDVPPQKRDLAMVFQNYALYPHMTVYKNLAFALTLRKTPKIDIDRRVRQTAKLLDIEPLLGRKTATLSGGQRQRVALGRAIVRKPKAFLLDEPLSNLDANLRCTMRTELKELHEKLETTTIYVTHDQEEAMSLADRLVVMCDGRVRQAGEPMDIYKAPADRFVAAFVGTPTMNFLQGIVRRADQKIVFDLGADQVDLPENLRGPLAKHLDQPMVLGFRPENVWLQHEVNDTKDKGVRDYVTMEVKTVERLGRWQDVSLASKNQHALARCDAQMRLRKGQWVQMKLDPEALHVFDAGDVGSNVTKDGSEQR